MGKQNLVHLTPKETMYFEGREVVRITCKMTQTDIIIRKQKLKNNKPNTSKPIKCSNGKIYKSITKAAEELSVSSSSISKVLKGKQNTTKGYSFKYQ